MNGKKRLSIIMFVLFLSAATLFILSCGEPSPGESADATPTENSGTSSAITPDLSVPPPGSQATQEKWDGFDEAKKKDSWAKYLAENAPDGAAPTSTPTPPPTDAAPEASTGTSRSPVVSVVVGELTKAPITLYYYGLGELKAGQEQRVSPQISGVVASLYVNEGDFVETGDLLFSLDDSDLVREMELVSEKWSAELELAQIRLNEALSDYESSESLYARDLITKAEYDNAKKGWEEAKIAFDKVRLARTTELEKLQENLRTNLSISPGRGYISEITFNEGEQVNTSDFVEIVDIEHIIISIQVPENIITRIRMGNEVFAKQASAPSYSLEGVVTGRGIISDNNRSFEVVAKLENPDQKLLPGMLMETQIRVTQMTSNFIIPKESLLQDGADQFIFLVKDGTARRTPVTTGQSRGNLVQVSGTIDEGDLLVLQGQSYLREGMTVNIVETKEYLPESREL